MQIGQPISSDHDDFRCRRPRGPGIRCRRNDAAAHQCAAIPPPPLRHDAPDLLHRRVRHQPVDGHLDARRHPPRDEASGRPCARPTRNWGTPSSWSSRSPGCPTWSTPPTAACSSTARPSSPASPTRSAQARPPPTPSGWLATASSPADTRHVNEGQGDLLVVGSIDPGGLRLSHRPARTRRDRRRDRGLPVVSLELVDPRFYHLDTALAVLDDTTIAYYPPAFSDESRTRLARAVPRRHRGSHAPTPTCSASTPSPTAGNVVLPGGRNRFRRASSPMPGSSRSASTCPSCSRAADPSNAARWRCIRDHPGRRDPDLGGQ